MIVACSLKFFGCTFSRISLVKCEMFDRCQQEIPRNNVLIFSWCPWEDIVSSANSDVFKIYINNLDVEMAHNSPGVCVDNSRDVCLISVYLGTGSMNHTNDSVVNGGIIQLNSSNATHSIKINCTGNFIYIHYIFLYLL